MSRDSEAARLIVVPRRYEAQNEAQIRGRLFLHSIVVWVLLFFMSVFVLLKVPGDAGIAVAFSLILVISVCGMAWFAFEARRLNRFLKRQGDKGIL